MNVDASVVTNVLLWLEMLVMGETRVGIEGIGEISVPSTHIFSKPKTAVRK